MNNNFKKFFAITWIMSILISCSLPVFAESKQITLNGNTYTIYSADEMPSDARSASSLGVTGRWYIDASDYENATQDYSTQNTQISLNIDSDTKEFAEASKDDLRNISSIMADFKPNFNLGANVLAVLKTPISAVLGVLYVAFLIYFLAVEGYNFFLIILDGAYESTGAGATSTDQGATNGIIAWLNKRITNNTKSCLQMDKGRFSKWASGEIVKLAALGIMIMLFVNGLAFKFIITIGDALMKLVGVN